MTGFVHNFNSVTGKLLKYFFFCTSLSCHPNILTVMHQKLIYLNALDVDTELLQFLPSTELSTAVQIFY